MPPRSVYSADGGVAYGPGNLGTAADPDAALVWGPNRLFPFYIANPYAIAPEITDYYGLNNLKHVAQILATFNAIVLDKSVVFDPASFPAGARTINAGWSANGALWAAIIPWIKTYNPNCMILGYIPCSQAGPDATNWQLTTPEYQAALVQWMDIVGADGPFNDQFGYDFLVSRTWQNDAINSVIAQDPTAPYMANAWLPLQVMGSAVDPVFNPGGVAPVFGGSRAWFLLESYAANLVTSDTNWRSRGLQNFRLTVAANGVQGFNERMQNAHAGRVATACNLAALAVIPQGANTYFYTEFVESLAVMWSIPLLGISKNDAFADVYPNDWPRRDWASELGSVGLYDPLQQVRTVNLTVNGGGTTPSGYASNFQRGAMSIGYDSTVGQYWRTTPNGSWLAPSAGPGNVRDLPWKTPVDTVITAPVDLSINTTVNGYAEGLVAESQNGVTLQKGMRVLLTAQAATTDNRVFDVDNNTAGLCYLVPAADFGNGLQDMQGACVVVAQGDFAGAIYRLTTPNPMVLGTTGLTWSPIVRMPSGAFINAAGTFGVAPVGNDAVALSAAGTPVVTAKNDGAAKLGFFNVAPAIRPTVLGTRAGNPALANLLTALQGLGLIIDGTTP